MTASAVPISPLEKLRKERGLARAKVASDLDLSERHLYRLERGITPISRANALMFADYYGVTFEQIENGQVAA